MEAKLDLWIVLFIAATAQGAFLSSLLLLKRSKKEEIKTRQYLLGSLMTAFTITIAYYLTYWTQVNHHLDWKFSLILYLPLLFGPLSFLYIHHIIKGQLPKNIRFHFIPFISVSILFLVLPLLFPNTNNHLFLNIILVLHVVTYAINNLKLVKAHASDQWLKNISISYAGYALCLAIYYILSWVSIVKPTQDYIVSMGMSIFIYFIGYNGFRAPLMTSLYTKEQKYQKSSLTNDMLAHIMEKVDQLMKDEKLFVKDNLKLMDLAKRLELTPHAVSQAINVIENKKYTEYLSELRVDEAIRLMKEPDNSKTKLFAIAIDSGFNNKTSFLNAFKRQTGQSPSDYRKSICSYVS